MADEKLKAVLKSLKPLLPLPPGHRSSPPPPEFLVAMDYVKEFHPTLFPVAIDPYTEHNYTLELYRKAMGREPRWRYQTHRTIWAACVYLVEMLHRSEITKRKEEENE